MLIVGSVFKGIRKLLLVLEGAVVFVAAVTAALMYSLSMWVFKTWNHLTMEELVYQLQAPIQGTNSEMISDGLSYCLPLVTVVGLAFLVVFIGMRKTWRYHLLLCGALAASVLTARYVVNYATERLDFETYTQNQETYSGFIDTYYVAPDSVEMQFPDKKRNLIYIFLESMEVTYADRQNGGGFEVNCIPELTALAQANEDFSGDSSDLNGGYSMPSTTWTVAAMFAQTSGLPLSIPIGRNSMDTQDSFFPEVTTLGDILEEQGYSQTLLIGSDAAFGGRQLLYRDHGNFTIKDYNYARENALIPEDYLVWWGYEDARMFTFAKQELLELAAKGEPFNLTLLTVDTHFEDGYVCEFCQSEFGDNQYANVMACSSRQVDAFVKWIQEQDFYENTTIVLAGDHPTMDGDFCQDVDKEYIRKVYTSYINPAAPPAYPSLRRNFTTYDFFPTTLASLGVQIPGDRLGLGTNLFSGELTLTEKFGIEGMRTEVQKKSELVERLAAGIEAQEPVASVTADIYNHYGTKVFQVKVGDLQTVGKDIRSIQVGVWTLADQSDLRWIQAQLNEDSVYYAGVDLADFSYAPGEYHISAVLTDVDGGQYVLGNTVVNVE